MILQRTPRADLRPFVERVWAQDPDEAIGAARERVLPTGAMHVVFRLDAPLRVYDGPDDPRGRTIGTAVVGGARAAASLRDVSRPTRSVGAMLRPGAAEAVLGVPAGPLAGRHTDLADLWRGTGDLHAWLGEAPTLAARLDRFESILLARLPRVRGVHPAIAFALERFASTREVAPVAAASGYSQRRFLALFREAVGLSPKVYCRVGRLQDALARAARGERWADVALAAGYSDQAHLVREFREIAGVTPGEYLRASPRALNHVPVGPLPIRPRRRPAGGPC
jgi:AraC-like DNA-binding protein